jgi:uncharacterized membrane protein
MSAAKNDPFTTMTCRDNLADCLVKLLNLGESSPNYQEDADRLHLIYEPVAHSDWLISIDMLRHASCDYASLLLHMLDAIEAIRQDTTCIDSQTVLLRHVDLIRAESQVGSMIHQDRQAVHSCCNDLYGRLSTNIEPNNQGINRNIG